MEPLHLLAPAAALVAGFAHALEGDHVAAVTTFVSRRPHPLRAVWFGLRWGIGHSAAILAAGSVLVAAGVRVSDLLARGLEFGVGAMLVGLGGWLLWTLLHERGERARRADHSAAPAHPHGRGTLWVGVAHGLAGTAPLVAVLSATSAPTPAAAAGYLLLFGAGTTAAMALYALAAGVVFDQAANRAPALAGVLRAATAAGSGVLGVMWMVNAAAGA